MLKQFLLTLEDNKPATSLNCFICSSTAPLSVAGLSPERMAWIVQLTLTATCGLSCLTFKLSMTSEALPESLGAATISVVEPATPIDLAGVFPEL